MEVFVNSMLAYEQSLTSLADAQAFFTDNPIDIGFGPGGPADVKLVFDLTASQVSSGFEFTHAFDPVEPLSGVPRVAESNPVPSEPWLISPSRKSLLAGWANWKLAVVW